MNKDQEQKLLRDMEEVLERLIRIENRLPATNLIASEREGSNEDLYTQVLLVNNEAS